MQDRDKILNFLRITGPTTPTNVAKNIKSDVLLASALLSDLSSQGKVRVSKLKIGGGSPLYYLSGQEEQLFKFAEENVNPKDYQVLVRLKEDKLLREQDLDLLSRLALRGLKDFAIPLNVNFQGEVELFWKWHLANNEDANKLIGQMINASPQNESEPETQIEDQGGKVEEVKEIEANKIEAEQEVLDNNEIEDNSEVQVEPVIKEENKEENVKKVPKQEEKISEQEIKTPEKEIVKKEKKEEETPKYNVKEDKEEEKEEQKKLSSEGKKSLLQKVKEKVVKRKRKSVEDEFVPQIEQFFLNLNIKIQQKETVRKNAEVNFTVNVPSVVGQITYFCKAKNKSRSDEKDLSAAYMEAQAKKMPLLFLYTNELNKRSWEMLDSGVFQNVVVKKIE
jgi:hypothetical protein